MLLWICKLVIFLWIVCWKVDKKMGYDLIVIWFYYKIQKNELIIRECFWYSANIQYCAKVMQRIIVVYRDNREISTMFQRYFRRDDLSAIYRRAIVLTTARYRRYIVEPLMNYRFSWTIYRLNSTIYRLNSTIYHLNSTIYRLSSAISLLFH